MTNARRIALNLATLVPGVASIPPVRAYLAKRRTGTRGTDSARYCYAVWMRHLVMASRSGLLTTPRIIAELGPGDSLGTGIAGLLCGASRYYAFDVVEHASTQRNVAILRALVPLFRDRAAIPDAAEFPNVHPRLEDYSFPRGVLPDERLTAALEPARLEHIEASLAGNAGADSLVQYRAPWYGESTIETGTVDMIFSQAVLEHVDDLAGTYHAMARWLKPGGLLSHEIDFQEPRLRARMERPLGLFRPDVEAHPRAGFLAYQPRAALDAPAAAGKRGLPGGVRRARQVPVHIPAAGSRHSLSWDDGRRSHHEQPVRSGGEDGSVSALIAGLRRARSGSIGRGSGE